MMVEFVPNLDDGELWIPSDILIADVPSPAAPLPSPTTTDFDLTRHFAALSLLNRPSQSQSANQYALTASPTPSPTRPTAFRSGLPYFYANPLLQPGQPHQTRFIVQNAVSRPLQPGFERKCGGTGVFLPRTNFYRVRRKQGSGNRNVRRMSQERNEQGRRSHQLPGPVAPFQETTSPS